MGRKTAKSVKSIGRPLVVDAIVLQKLEEIFALGGTDQEACLYAGISPATLYNYQERTPAFIERKQALKETPVLKARRTVVESLETDVNSAWRYVERKDPELHPKQQVDVTSKGDKLGEPSEEIRRLTKELNDLHKQG